MENAAITCIKCISGYYFDKTQKKCIQASFLDCTAVDTFSKKCISCDYNKSLMPNNFLENNKCVKIPEVLSKYCKDFTFQITGSEGIACNSCLTGYYPRLFDNSNYSFCVAEN